MSNDNDFMRIEGQSAGAAFNEYLKGFVEGAIQSKNRAVKADLPNIQRVAANAFVEYYKHLLELQLDKYGIPQPVPAEDHFESFKDCDACCCNMCAKLNDCPVFPPADGITPRPCAVCIVEKRDKPLVPKNNKCPSFEERKE